MDGSPTPAPAQQSIGTGMGWSEPATPSSRADGGAQAPHRLPPERSAGWAGLLGWLVPGLGQAYLGRFGAAAVLLLVIGGTFAGGLALTDYTCVDPRTYKLEAVAHALIGGPSALTLALTQDVTLARMPPYLEVGRLYVVVAGFLNLVALCDALGECWRHNARIHALRARMTLRNARPAFEPAVLSDAAFLEGADDASGARLVPVEPVPPAPPATPAEGPP